MEISIDEYVEREKRLERVVNEQRETIELLIKRIKELENEREWREELKVMQMQNNEVLERVATALERIADRPNGIRPNGILR